jgi:hypothetical protein
MRPATKWRPNELPPNIFKNQSCAPMLYRGWIRDVAGNKNGARQMLILIISFVQVKFCDGSQVEGVGWQDEAS